MSQRDAAPFDFTLGSNGRALDIRVNAKKFDVAMAKDFRAAVESAWKPGIASVQIDFTRVEFIDSAGVGALISVHKRLPAPAGRTIDPANRAVTIINASP